MAAPLVLVVDDDPAIQALLTDLLTDAGYRVTCHASGADVFKRVRHAAARGSEDDRPAAILLDISLPGRTGIQVLKDLQGDPCAREVPVIVMSAERGFLERARPLAQEALAKPFHAREVVEVVDRARRRPPIAVHN